MAGFMPAISLVDAVRPFSEVTGTRPVTTVDMLAGMATHGIEPLTFAMTTSLDIITDAA